MMRSRVGLGGGPAAAWSWWTGELAAIVPAAVRRRLAALRGQQLLVLGVRDAEIVYEAGGRRYPVGRLDLVSGATSAPASIRRQPTFIHLAPGQGLRSQFPLPLAASRNLAQVVGFEIERRTPFRKDEVYVAHRVLRRDPKAQRLEVELSVAPRAIVDEALRLARAAGLQVAGVAIAGAKRGERASANLLPGRKRPAARSLYGMTVAVLVVAIIGLGAAAAAIPLLQARAVEADLTARVAAAKQRAEAAIKLEKEVGEAARDAQFLTSRRRQTMSVSELLNTLTHLLPDDTWLAELQVTANEVQLSGYSNSATALLSLLDETAGFTNAAFRSSVTQDTRLNREQFDIAAKLKPRGQP